MPDGMTKMTTPRDPVRGGVRCIGGAYQEAHKAKVCVLRAKAAEVKDAQDSLAFIIQIFHGLF
jgi:hypothetical protein